MSFKTFLKYKTHLGVCENLVQIDSDSGILAGCDVVLQVAS